ncbi:MAG TPA: dephospho-CoA kinase [Alphaproteobacteria bacterium]|nr:dephospho-CoA kinase [Alphaproteobacteria bacterium]
MITLGLTGSIGMGKSTAAGMLRRMGVPVYCADEAVHRLLGPGGAAVADVAALYPAAIRHESGKAFIDRAALGHAAFADRGLMKRLEGILHPLARKAEQDFLKRARAQRRKLVVLDIPLLLETGGQSRVDAVLVVHAPSFVQRQRVMARPGMTQEKLRAVLARQMPAARKLRYADYIIPTGLGHAFTWKKLKKLVQGGQGIG